MTARATHRLLGRAIAARRRGSCAGSTRRCRRPRHRQRRQQGPRVGTPQRTAADTAQPPGLGLWSRLQPRRAPTRHRQRRQHGACVGTPQRTAADTARPPGLGLWSRLQPDGRQLATVGWSTAPVWELPSGWQLLQLDHAHRTGQAAFRVSADWRCLAMGSAVHEALRSSAGFGRSHGSASSGSVVRSTSWCRRPARDVPIWGQSRRRKRRRYVASFCGDHRSTDWQIWRGGRTVNEHRLTLLGDDDEPIPEPSFGVSRSVAGRRQMRRSVLGPTARRPHVLMQMICARVLARSANSHSARDRRSYVLSRCSRRCWQTSDGPLGEGGLLLGQGGAG
jgi:hypothetical protein